MPKNTLSTHRNNLIAVRLNDKEKARLESFAESEGLSLSEAFRLLLERHTQA